MPVKTAKRKVGERVVEPPKLVVLAPKNQEEAAEFVRKVGDEQRKLEAIAADAGSRIALIQETATKNAQPHQEGLDRLVDGLFKFFEMNRDELTNGGKRKSVDLGTGTIGEHTNPHKVELTDKKEAVLANLKKLGLTDQFIRTAEEVNREAMLESEESRALAVTVKGVKITQAIEFLVKPADTLTEVVADEARLKRRIA